MSEPEQRPPGKPPALSGWLLAVGGTLLLAALALPNVYAPAFHPTNESLRLYSAATLEAGLGADVAPVFDAVSPRWRERGVPPNIDVATLEDRWLLDKPPGTTLLAVPVLRAMRWLGLSAEHNQVLRLLALLLCLLPSLLAAWWLARRSLPDAGVPMRWAFTMLLLAATPWAFLAVRLFGHATSAALFTMGVLLLLGPVSRATSEDERPPHAWQGAGGGLLLGIAVVVETTLAPAVLLLLGTAVAFPATRARALWSVAGGAAPAVVLAWWNTSLFGSPLAFGYAYKWHAGHAEIVDAGLFGFTWPSLENLHGVLFSRERGLLTLSPWLSLGFLGVLIAAGERSLSGPWRVFLPMMVVGYTLWIASFGDWHGGWFAGPRHLLPAVPFLGAGAIVLADVLARGRGWPPETSRVLVLALAVGASWVVLHVSGTLVYFPEGVEEPITRLSHQAWVAMGPYPVLGAEGDPAARMLRLLVIGGIVCLAAGLWLQAGGGDLRRRWPWVSAAALAAFVGLLLSVRAWGSPPSGPPADPRVEAAERIGLELRLEERGAREQRLELPMERR